MNKKKVKKRKQVNKMKVKGKAIEELKIMSLINVRKMSLNANIEKTKTELRKQATRRLEEIRNNGNKHVFYIAPLYLNSKN